MKIIFTYRVIDVLLTVICLHTMCAAQSWKPLGPDDFNQPSYNAAEFTSIAVDAMGTPYVVYQDNDGPNNGKATVMKYNGSTWVVVGKPGFSADNANYTRIAINKNGTPYVVYSDGSAGGNATVMMYNGISWVTVGNAGFSASTVAYTSIAIDGNGTPYVAYQDGGNSNAATVMKFDGSNWVTVGNAAFSAGPVNYPDIAIDNNGAPYVAYEDGSNNSPLVVMKFDGSTWQAVGNTAGIAPLVQYTRIAISGGAPYVVYEDGSNSNKATVITYNGTDWAPVGNAGFSSSAAVYTDIALDSSGIPYIAFQDNNSNYLATLMKYDGTNWVTLGMGHQANWLGIAIGGNSLPYIAYTDFDNSTAFNKVTVMKWDGASLVIVGETGFSQGEDVDNTNIALDSSNTPFVAYDDRSGEGFQGAKANVRKFVNGYWQPVGNSNFSTGISYYMRMALNPAGIPYVVYQNNISDGDHALTVMKLAGGVWVPVGTAGTARGDVMYLSIAIDKGGTPYLAYRDIANSNFITVVKFDGTNWVPVGGAFAGGGYLTTVNMVLDSSGMPYIVYEDGDPFYGASGRATVLKFNGSAWVKVGKAGFSAAAAYSPNIGINNKGVPYVVYSDGTNLSLKTTVMEYTGTGTTGWKIVGKAGFSADNSTSGVNKITFDKTGNPFIIYQNNSHGQATVMRFDGTAWVTVGGTTMSAGYAEYPDLAITKTGTAIAVYDNGGAFAKTFNLAPVITSFSPAAAYKTATVTIKGHNFTGATEVSFGGAAAASYKVTSDTTITAVVDTGATGVVSVTAPYGTATKAGFTFLTCTPVKAAIGITADAGPAICGGTTVTFTAKAANGGTPVYQWYRDGVAVGTNSNKYKDSKLADGDSVYCVMTSTAGCLVSNPVRSNALVFGVTPRLVPTLAITSNAGTTFCKGTVPTLTAAATNAGVNPKYQWKKNGVAVGTNSNTYTDSTLKSNDQVTCVVTATQACVVPASVTGKTLTFKVNALVVPVVTITPNISGPVCAGTKMTFTSTVVNGGKPAYRWYRNGVATGGANGSGSTFANGQLKDGDSVWCIITATGTCLASPTVRSNVYVFKVFSNKAPVLTITNNAAAGVCPGAPVTFMAITTDTITNPQYMWKRNNIAVGSNMATYIDSVPQNGDSISCTLTETLPCAAGQAVSYAAVMLSFSTVALPAQPSAISGPGSVAANQAGVSFTVTKVSGLAYTWTVPAGVTIVSGQGTFKLTVNWGSTTGNVSVTTANRCGNSPASTKKVSLAAGLKLDANDPNISSSTAGNSLRVYPNPVTSTATIEFTAETVNKYEAQVMNAVGQLVTSKSGMTIRGLNTVKFEMGNMASAIYYVRLIDAEHGTRIIKLVKAK